jgi:hypothetical protein
MKKMKGLSTTNPNEPLSKLETAVKAAASLPSSLTLMAALWTASVTEIGRSDISEKSVKEIIVKKP